MLQPGDRCGDTTLERFVARGGNSDVWLARSDDDRQVVVRIPRVAGLPRGKLPSWAVESFLQQISIWKSVSHPGLVRVLSTGVDNDVRYVVTEHADGIDLLDLFSRAERLDRWPSAEMCAAIVAQTADALQALHDTVDSTGLPVVHRGISPDKIVVTRDGVVRVLDPAWVPMRQEDIATASTKPTSKTPYMSPDVVSNPGCGDPRADLFSLGIVLWELLSHRALFKRETDLDTFRAVSEAVIPSLPATVPVHLGIVASKCLAKDPADRYPSGAEVSEALTLALGDHPDAKQDRIAALVPRDSPTEMSDSSPQGVAGDTAQETVAPFGDEFFDPARDRPTTVGKRFQLLERIGAGGMGEVYLAYDLELAERIALKVIAPEYAGDTAQIERMRREVRLARKIKSERVCRIHDILELPNGGRGVSMELIDGKTISALIREGLLLDYARIARWGADIAEGLTAAHAINVVHRDLKPDNVMINTEDRAVILDFGVARSRDQSRITGGKLTEENIILGTIPYMAPEQLTNGRLDGRTDLYALGLIIAELITGETPFGANTYNETLNLRVVKPTRYRLLDVDAQVPPALASIVDRLLRTHPEDRPRDAAEVAAALAAIGAETELPSGPVPAPAGGGTLQMEVDPLEAPEPLPSAETLVPDTEMTPAPSDQHPVAGDVEMAPRRVLLAIAVAGCFLIGAVLTYTLVTSNLAPRRTKAPATATRTPPPSNVAADATAPAVDAAHAIRPADEPPVTTPTALPKHSPAPDPKPKRPKRPRPLAPAEEM